MKAGKTILLIFVLANAYGCTLADEGLKTKPSKTQMTIKIGSKAFTASLEENATATAFKAMLPMTVKMSELNGNEKFFRLPNKVPTKAMNPEKIENGDLMIYGADTLVLFYNSFPTSYSYTRLGRVNDPGGLAAAVGSGDVTVSYELK